jgi:hypothetical protein
MGSVPAAGVAAPAQLAADRGGCASQQDGDLAHRPLLSVQVGQSNPFILGQVSAALEN